MREFAAGASGKRPKDGRDLEYFKLYLKYLRPHSWSIALGFLVIPLITVVHLLQPVLIKQGIDVDIAAGDMAGLQMTGTWFGLCVLLELVCRSLQSYLFQKVGIQSVTALRKDLFDHLLKQSSSYFDRNPVGRLTTRVSSDIEALNETFSSGLITLLADLLNIIGIAAIMFYLSPELTLVTLAFVPPIILVVNYFKTKLRTYYTRIRTSISSLNTNLEEQLSGYRIVQLFLREEKNYKKFQEENNNYKRANMGSISYDSLLYSIMDAVSSVVIGVIIWFSFERVIDGAFTLGLLVAFIDYTRKFFQPLRELSGKFAILQAALAALEKIFVSFSVNEELETGEEVLEKSRSTIEFKNVSFSYPGFEDKPVLKSLDFNLEPGAVLAIVGPTGGGKSSISKLVSLLYDNYEGEILFGDTELRTFSTSSVRSRIAVVTQDVEIFSDTVEFNISLGSPDISPEDCEAAAKLVQADKFINELPEGYQTRLEAGGSQLSAGQAQLLSFARALAANTPIIILDEATAAVDSLSENLLQKATEHVLREKTVLVIAHRLSTIREASEILAIKEGQIIERGDHESLVAADGYYAKLFQMQFAHI